VSKWVLWIIVPSEVFIILVFSLIFGANITNGNNSNGGGGGGGPTQPLLAWIFYAGLGGMVLGMGIVVFRAFRQTRQMRESLAAESHLQQHHEQQHHNHHHQDHDDDVTTTSERTSLLNHSRTQ
jgi:hypothetical protein